MPVSLSPKVNALWDRCGPGRCREFFFAANNAAEWPPFPWPNRPIELKAPAAAAFDANADGFGDPCVSPTVVINAAATVDSTATNGALSVVNKGVVVEGGTALGESVTLSQSAQIGTDVVIGNSTTIRQKSVIGDWTSIGAAVVVERTVTPGVSACAQ